MDFLCSFHGEYNIKRNENNRNIKNIWFDVSNRVVKREGFSIISKNLDITNMPTKRMKKTSYGWNEVFWYNLFL